jgi:hypothetical protein
MIPATEVLNFYLEESLELSEECIQQLIERQIKEMDSLDQALGRSCYDNRKLATEFMTCDILVHSYIHGSRVTKAASQLLCEKLLVANEAISKQPRPQWGVGSTSLHGQGLRSPVH